MPRFVDPLGPLGPDRSATGPLLFGLGDALAAFGDALAVPALTGDPLAAPLPTLPDLLGPVDSAARGPGPKLSAPPTGADSDPTHALDDIRVIEPVAALGATGLTAASLDAMGLDVTRLDAADADPAADTATLDTAALQAAARAAAAALTAAPVSLEPADPGRQRPSPGRISVGLPRGWKPSSVPPNRGWSRRSAMPPPPRLRRRQARALATAADAGADPSQPQPLAKFAAVLARFQRRPRVGRRGMGALLLVAALLGLLFAPFAAASHRGGVVWGVIVLVVGLSLMSYSGRLARTATGRDRPDDSEFRPPAG